ncbi:MAG: V-type ATP synthase subunit E [Candidatus Micrarchaeota archaeon]
MGIERITSSIIAQANEQAEEQIQSAQKIASKNIADAKAAREELLKKAKKSVEEYGLDHEKERLAWARLEAKRVVAETKEDIVKSAFESMFSDFADLRKSTEYKNFLKNAIASSVKELGSENILVHCLKGEKSLLVSNTKIKVIEDLDSLGGCIVELSNKSVKIDLTLEALFENKREDIRKELYAKFFFEKKKTK